MKQAKANSSIRFLWLFLLLSVMILVGIWMVFDPPGEKTHYMDKADMYEIVRNNAQTILDDIEKNDYTRTLSLLSSSREKPHVEFSGDCVLFYCYGHGFASNTGYEGFYYTPSDGPAGLGGIDVSSLKQEGNEWTWYEKSRDPGGDNEYHTEKICDFLWYYRLEY